MTHGLRVRGHEDADGDLERRTPRRVSALCTRTRPATPSVDGPAKGGVLVTQAGGGYAHPHTAAQRGADTQSPDLT